jgi:hypothetical protein
MKQRKNAKTYNNKYSKEYKFLIRNKKNNVKKWKIISRNKNNIINTKNIKNLKRKKKIICIIRIIYKILAQIYFF